MTITEKNTENQKSGHLSEIIRQLSPNQIRFIVARLESPSKKDAAEAIGLSPDTVYNWNEKDLIDEAIHLITENAQGAAQAIIVKYAIKAAMVKAGGLDSGDERIRQGAATEILDRNLGKPKQPQEITGKDGRPIETKDVTYTDDQRANLISAIIDRARTRDSGPDTGQ